MLIIRHRKPFLFQNTTIPRSCKCFQKHPTIILFYLRSLICIDLLVFFFVFNESTNHYAKTKTSRVPTSTSSKAVRRKRLATASSVGPHQSFWFINLIQLKSPITKSCVNSSRRHSPDDLECICQSGSIQVRLNYICLISIKF